MENEWSEYGWSCLESWIMGALDVKIIFPEQEVQDVFLKHKIRSRFQGHTVANADVIWKCLNQGVYALNMDSVSGFGPC